ncbi:MAG: hypothetical protein JRF30_06080 [Deltaproteobacteria bacterium]|nr:hypothetical protein [Deltaproteobacteria bacterium]MBW2330490.1 hypothetical protein [Deltaproteobacteria bacterium]
MSRAVFGYKMASIISLARVERDFSTKRSRRTMKKCVKCGRAFNTLRRCQVCGKEINATTGTDLNFCILCYRCLSAIEKGLDLKEYRKKKKERMKRCADCINEKDGVCR